MKLAHTTFADSDGFIKRECPDCYFTYKIKALDWENKIFEYEVFCPKCKKSAPSDSWWTEEQTILIKGLLRDARYLCDTEPLVVNRPLHDRFEGVNGYESLSYRKDRLYSFTNNPVGIKRSFENNIRCASCGTEFKTAGGAFVCPCCSFDNTISRYRPFLKKTEKMLGCISEIKEIILAFDGQEEADLFERETVYGISLDLFENLEVYAKGLLRIIGIEKYCDASFSSLNKINKSFTAVFGRGIIDEIDRDSVITAQAVMEKVFSHKNKKRKEKTPCITVQDVDIALKMLTAITERMTRVAFGR